MRAFDIQFIKWAKTTVTKELATLEIGYITIGIKKLLDLRQKLKGFAFKSIPKTYLFKKTTISVTNLPKITA